VILVLDSSVTLAWVYGGETTTTVREVFAAVVSDRAWVPSLWRLEVANVLEMGVRRGRHDSGFRDATLSDLLLLPITTDAETDLHAWRGTLSLASRHGLTLYDAAYLELAQRRRLPLATLDSDLRIAGEREGVPLLGL
jgi:predicted nucleic acid-binding protein